MDIVGTIEDDEQVDNLSEDSDVEIEVWLIKFFINLTKHLY